VFSITSQRRLDGDRQDQLRADRHRHPARQKPQREIEDEAVDDVGRRVPVGDVLGVLRAHHQAVPQFDVTAFTDGQMPHGEEDGALQRDEAKHGEDDLGAGDVIWVRI